MLHVIITETLCLKDILWCLLVNFWNWNMLCPFVLPMINKKDQHTNLWIKRFSVPSFFACAHVALNRKSIWHDPTAENSF